MSVGTQPMNENTYSSGVGYVSLVSDLDRTEYIRLCYRTSTVSMKMEDGSVYHRVPVPPSVLNFISFPNDVQRRGTALVWVTESVKGSPIVVNYLNSTEDLSTLEEGMYQFSRRSEYGNSSIVGSDRGFLSLLTSKIIKQKITNKDHSGEYTVEVQGTVDIDATREVSISSDESISITAGGKQDEEQSSIEINETLIEVRSNVVEMRGTERVGLYSENEVEVEGKTLGLRGERIFLGYGNQDEEQDSFEPLLLGKKTINFIEELLDLLYKARVPTQTGMVPLSNYKLFDSLKEKLEELQSKTSNTQ